MSSLKAVVRTTVRRHAMFQSGQALLVAVSGGADSVALLHVLVDLSAEMSLRLGVAHLDHGIRGADAAADARFVASLAAGYRLPFYVHSVDTRRYAFRRGLSLEDAGRRLRYRFLLETAHGQGFDRVAVGHHRDDNAESVLMGLLRGSGGAGMGGIAPVRADGVVRPLIRLSRRDIRDYLGIHGLAFVEDRSNDDVGLLRNRLRLELLPLLAADYNPNITQALNRLGTILRGEDQWLSELSASLYADVRVARVEGVVELSLKAFAGLHPAARRRLVRLALAEIKGDLRRIGFTHVSAVLQLAKRAAAGGELDLPEGIRVRRTSDRLEFAKVRKRERVRRIAAVDSCAPLYRYELAAPGAVTISETGERIEVHPVGIGNIPAVGEMAPDTAYMDADRVRFPLAIRNFRPGDRFSPLGTAGTQKLKKYFCDHKVPPPRRRMCPLLLCEDRIVWVAGQRIDNAARLTGATRRVLKAALSLA